MHEMNPSVPNLIWGVSAISKAINRTERSVYHLLEKNEIAGAKKIGGVWCLSLDVFMAQFEE